MELAELFHLLEDFKLVAGLAEPASTSTDSVLSRAEVESAFQAAVASDGAVTSLGREGFDTALVGLARAPTARPPP